MLNAKIKLCEWGSEMCRLPEGSMAGIGDECIVEVDGAPQWGIVQEISEYGADPETVSGCVFLRLATPEDHAARRKLETLETEAVQRFRELAGDKFPDVHPLCARYGFDGESVTLYFRCDKKVEWHNIGEALEQCLRTKVHLRQLGPRDEAAFLGGIGICGRQLCCSSWIRRFQAVNVRMAKTQNLSLNPAAISGLCGRLKCCLRFEYHHYCKAEKGLPNLGEKVRWNDENGTVIGRDVLRGRLSVRLSDRRIVHAQANELRPACGACRHRSEKGENENPHD